MTNDPVRLAAAVAVLAGGAALIVWVLRLPTGLTGEARRIYPKVWLIMGLVVGLFGLCLATVVVVAFTVHPH
jgi:hypothetical protein